MNVVPTPVIVVVDCDAVPVVYVSADTGTFPVSVALSIVGASEKTRLLEVVPVGPVVVYPVMLLKAVIDAEPEFVPPFATGIIVVPDMVPLITGVVNVGVVKVGVVENTRLVDVDPVVPEVVLTPVPPLANGRMPLTCAVRLTAPDVTAFVADS